MASEQEKASNGTGTVERRGKQWWARISLPDGRRKRVPIPKSEKMSKAMAREKAALISDAVRTGKIVFDETPGRRNGALPSPMSSALTVRQLATAWTSGALHERFGTVNRLRVKASAKIDAWTLAAHVLHVKTRSANGPVFGDLPVTAVTTKDVIAVMGAQPTEQASQTRLHTYQRIRRLFDLAIFPLELRTDSPVIRQLRPTLTCDKEFAYLFPGEVLALLRGTNADGVMVIPLARRILYVLAVYTGFRRESLLTLAWGNLDAQNRSLVALKTKTGKPAFAEGDPPSLFILLAAYYEHLGRPDTATLIVTEKAIGCPAREFAKTLREDLQRVGVTRALLFDDKSPNVEPLRFHDTRATFEVWARRAGWSQDRIDRRTGHTSVEMANRYMRAARTLDELRFAVFPDLTEAVPELTALSQRLANREDLGPKSTPSESHDPADFGSVRRRGLEPLRCYPLAPQSTEHTLNDEESAAKPSLDHAESMPLEAAKSAKGRSGDNEGATPIDALEAALARALEGATRAGEWSVVAQLASELEARRAGRAGNVIPIGGRRETR